VAPLAAERQEVIRTENEELWIISHRGCCGFSVFIAASGGFTGRGQAARLGSLGRLDLSRGNGQRTGASDCCSRRGHLGHVGVQFVATSALDQRRARIVTGLHRSAFGGCTLGSIGLPELLFIFLAVLIVWAVYGPRGPFSR